MTRAKAPPTNMARCCIGPCNGWSTLIYYKVYGLCDKHWSAYCDSKFKYKHFRDLRVYLGLPPIKKPPGHEDVPDHICDEIFAHYQEIEIDIDNNLPVLAYEEYRLWDSSEAAPPTPSEPQLDYCVQWNGIKQAPLDIFITVNNKNITLLQGLGTGVRFTSKNNVEKAVMHVQDILNADGINGLEHRVDKKFKNSKLWHSVECESILRKTINERT